MKIDRPPDFYVIGESGGRFPAYLQGQLSADSRLLVGFTATTPASPFVIDSEALCMATFTGTRLDIPVEAADPPTEVWQLLTR